jgi:hypothetical protein
MEDLDGCGWVVVLTIACILVIIVGFLFHIGWNLLDQM